MRRTFRRLAFAAVLILISLPVWAGDAFRLTILHTNDLHGMMQPFEYRGGPPQLTMARGDFGGLARRATAIEQIRKGSDHPVVVMDAGDVFTRGPWHTKWYGVPEIEAMGVMGYDMLCVGNNEVKPIWGDPKSKEMMLSLMRRSRFPWLAANLTLGDGPPPGCDAPAPVEGIHPYIVRTFGDVRVGFLGLTSAVSAEYPFLKGWTISDPIAAAKRWVPLARKECDILILVSHVGLAGDRRLAAEVPGIDAIVGGHSHSFLVSPEMVRSPSGREVPIAQAGEMGVLLGRLDLTFEVVDGWEMREATGELIPIDGSLAEHAGVKALLDRYLAEGVAAAPGAGSG